MDVNRRHLIGASAAGVAGALAMSPDAARAAPPTSALGRDATQYGVRPGSPDEQTRALQRAIDEAARAQVPLALPPGVYRTGLLRLSSGRSSSACAARPSWFSPAARRCFPVKAQAALALPTSRSTAAAFRCRRGAAWCIASPDAISASPIARSPAAAATASGSRMCPAMSAAISSRTSRPPRWCRSTHRA